ncbi:class I adenylate-forming enzyme family protein [Nocardia sp. NPDC052112]|uniref:class I adenylate-forming enzyme family protein n=1 Tax=Nocardia sp. NPDC052112 TaxID=3155646 RepID=UPI00343439A0
MFRTRLLRPVPMLLTQRALQSGPAIAFEDRLRTVDYRTLEARTARMAGHLVAAGLRAGDCVVIYLGNRVESVETTIAVTRAGCVGIPVSPNLGDDVLHWLIQQNRPAALFTTSRSEGALQAQRAPVTVVLPEDGSTTSIPGWCLHFEELASTGPTALPRDDFGIDDPAWILYAPRPGAHPTGVVATQRSSVWPVLSCYQRMFAGGGLHLLPVPLSYSYAHILCILGVIALGGSARLAGFVPDEVLEQVGGPDYTLLAGVRPPGRVCLTAGLAGGPAELLRQAPLLNLLVP